MTSLAPHKKLTRSHTSATELTAKVLNTICKLESVKKITLGIIKPNLKSVPQRIKLIPITGGARASIRSSTSVQQIFIYTTNIDELKKLIEKKTKINISFKKNI